MLWGLGFRVRRVQLAVACAESRMVGGLALIYNCLLSLVLSVWFLEWPGHKADSQSHSPRPSFSSDATYLEYVE